MVASAMFGEEDGALLPCTCGPHGSCARTCRNRPRKRGNPEAQIQRAVIDALRWHGILAVHNANEGKRSVIAGRVMKQNGLRPGWPDLGCYGRNEGEHGLMEVKADTGRLSPAQVECHDELRRRHVRIAVVRSVDDAIAAVRGWGWIA
jgi:hypothetical protein